MQQFIGFNAGKSEYVIPILKIREIISMPVITTLPHLPSYVKGITNLRGSIIPIINLSSLLNAYGEEDSGGIVIVISTGKVTFGIVVNGITGVVKIDESRIEPPDSFFNNNVDRIEGVAKLDDKLVVLLDTKKLLPLDDFSLMEDSFARIEESADGDNVEVTREIDTIGGKVTVKELHDAKEYLNDKLDDPQINARLFNLMLEFMEALSNQDYQKIESILNKLVSATDSTLFNEVGKITRKLHDSIEDFKSAIDNGLERVAKTDVPNAVDNLQFVLNKTEEAANRTMSIVERYFEESGELSSHLAHLKSPEASVSYLKAFKDALDNDMTDILTAQQFQDITGQTIKKVIKLVHSVEAELLSLIAQFGMQVRTDTESDENEKTADINDESPAEDDRSAEKITQSDVEALLGEYGF